MASFGRERKRRIHGDAAKARAEGERERHGGEEGKFSDAPESGGDERGECADGGAYCSLVEGIRRMSWWLVGLADWVRWFFVIDVDLPGDLDDDDDNVLGLAATALGADC